MNYMFATKNKENNSISSLYWNGIIAKPAIQQPRNPILSLHPLFLYDTISLIIEYLGDQELSIFIQVHIYIYI